MRAVLIYKSLGKVRQTAEVSGIPYDTLQNWREQDWWSEALLAAKQEDTVELEDAATQIAKKASNVLLDRLEHGDTVLDKDGNLIKKPVLARDAAVVLGISLQKRKELQEEPVRVAQLGVAERLLKLQQQFTQLAKAQQIEGKLDDSQNQTGLSGEVRERIEEPIEAEFIEGASSQEVGASGVLQNQGQEVIVNSNPGSN